VKKQTKKQVKKQASMKTSKTSSKPVEQTSWGAARAYGRREPRCFKAHGRPVIMQTCSSKLLNEFRRMILYELFKSFAYGSASYTWDLRSDSKMRAGFSFRLEAISLSLRLTEKVR